jgi:hypothetical protein
VCILYRVKAKDGVSISGFSQDSDSTNFILEPMLRSFDKKRWEVVAGPYIKQVEIRSHDRTAKTSKVRFRVNRDGEYKYVLMTFRNKFSDVNEERSRFLMQTTFGPKMSEITGWNYGDGVNGFGNWIWNQMNVLATPITSQREYYRKNLDWAMGYEFAGRGSVIPQDPCKKYSRWRDYSFIGADYGKEFIVSEIEVDGVPMHLISLAEEPRTVLENFESTDGKYSGPGTYTMGELTSYPKIFLPFKFHLTSL